MPTTARRRRHQAILRLVRSQALRSQAELRELLARRDLPVNQATLSRDLRELGVVKGAAGYALPADAAEDGGAARSRDALADALAQWLVEAIPVQHQVVLKTPAGGAQPLALALDRAPPAGLVGTIAGDDTVLGICRDARAARRLARLLLAGEGARP